MDALKGSTDSIVALLDQQVSDVCLLPLQPGRDGFRILGRGERKWVRGIILVRRRGLDVDVHIHVGEELCDHKVRGGTHHAASNFIFGNRQKADGNVTNTMDVLDRTALWVYIDVDVAHGACDLRPHVTRVRHRGFVGLWSFVSSWVFVQKKDQGSRLKE